MCFLMKKRIVILFNEVSVNARKDETDVLDQVQFVDAALKELGYETFPVQFSLKMDKVVEEIRRIKPMLVFNLVESVQNHGELIYFAPAVLKFSGVPFTGSGADSMFLTTHKVLTKKMIQYHGLPTSPFFTLEETHLLQSDRRYILKPIWEDGSLGLDEDSVFTCSNRAILEKIKTLPSENYFIEEYIDGREFNVSLLAAQDGPMILPPAEMLFVDYPEEKPKVVGYTAKWREDSFEYQHTQRIFPADSQSQSLCRTLSEIAGKCWKDFSLRGWARVDFRIDQQNRPYILEINANPSISPDSGFVAATREAEIPFPVVIDNILKDSLKEKS